MYKLQPVLSVFIVNVRAHTLAYTINTAIRIKNNNWVQLDVSCYIQHENKKMHGQMTAAVCGSPV